MCERCNQKLVEAQQKAREAVQKSAEEFIILLEKYNYGDLPTEDVMEWIRDLSQTTLTVVSADTLTELLMSMPHEGDTPTNH